MKRILTLAVALVMICTALTACGGGSGSQGNTNSTGKDSNSITVGIPQDLDSSLDPYQLTAAGTREVLFNVFEGLVKPDSKGEFYDAVASEHSRSDDGLTYTFTLRDGVKFHNGDTVTVEDVLYSFETCAATTVDSSLKAALSDVKVSAPDDKTIQIVLKKPSVEFINYVANVYIVPSDYKDQATNPVGTGPFKYVSRAVQENVILEKFEDYWGTPAKLDKITLRIYEDNNAMITALQSGSIDLCPRITVENTKTLPADFEVKEDISNLVQALYLNNDKEPFNDMKVRQALCYAINVDEIIDVVDDGHGQRIGSAMYPNFERYYDASLENTYKQDVKKAKKLLKEAGYENGFSFTITVPSNYTVHVDTATVIVEQLKAIGVTAKIKEIEWNTWISDVYIGRKYEATVIGFDAANLTAAAMLERYQSKADKNMFNYKNKEYDKTYKAAAAAVDEEEAVALYKQCEKILADTAANVYIMDLPLFVAVRTGLEGYEFYPLYVQDFSTLSWAE